MGNWVCKGKGDKVMIRLVMIMVSVDHHIFFSNGRIHLTRLPNFDKSTLTLIFFGSC